MLSSKKTDCIVYIEQLKKSYNNKEVLNIDSVSIEKGQVVGLVGNNGEGKTTLLSLLLDLILPDSGRAYIQGKNVCKDETWKQITGSFIDEEFLIPYLTPIEYLHFCASLKNSTKHEVEKFLKECNYFLDQSLFTDKKLIRELSKGNKAKVGILSAIITDPDLIILDEPFANLDPSSQSWLVKKIAALKAAGKTVIVSSHDLTHILTVSDRILLLNAGKLHEDVTDIRTFFELKD